MLVPFGAGLVPRGSDYCKLLSRVGSPEASLQDRLPNLAPLCQHGWLGESALGGSPIMEGQAKSAAYLTSIAFP